MSSFDHHSFNQRRKHPSTNEWLLSFVVDGRDWKVSAIADSCTASLPQWHATDLPHERFESPFPDAKPASKVRNPSGGGSNHSELQRFIATHKLGAVRKTVFQVSCSSCYLKKRVITSINTKLYYKCPKYSLRESPLQSTADSVSWQILSLRYVLVQQNNMYC